MNAGTVSILLLTILKRSILRSKNYTTDKLPHTIHSVYFGYYAIQFKGN